LNIGTSLVGIRDKVLIEKPDPRTKQRLQGRTRTNHIVNLEGPREWIGREIEVEITSAQSWSLSGKAMQEV
ncbi:TRAM domain-containing protein, partial [bacterium]|nr:TRAM domain-containing protein [bacterium]